MNGNAIEVVLIDSNRFFMENLEFELQHALKTTVKIISFRNVDECLQHPHLSADVVVYDNLKTGLNTKGIELTRLFTGMNNVNAKAEVILLSEVYSEELRDEALRTGIFDLSSDKTDLFAKLNTAIRKAIHLVLIRRKNSTNKLYKLLCITSGLVLLALIILMHVFNR